MASDSTDPVISPTLVTELLRWYAVANRPLPWREDPTPYHVLLSEIMLQQTRIEAVREAYARFLSAFPTLDALAKADESLLLKQWEGLGYYSRARNLQRAAKEILRLRHFPEHTKELKKLSGIGPYTAAAVSSIAFHHPAAAVDSNVLRVLSRLTTRNLQHREAEAMLLPAIPSGKAAAFTQAWMELGETICLPLGTPSCSSCPLQKYCLAYQKHSQQNYPAPRSKPVRKQIFRTVLLLQCGEKIAICKRPEKGLLAGMWELPGWDGILTPRQIRASLALSPGILCKLSPMPQTKHLFTHLEWLMHPWHITVSEELPGFFWMNRMERQTQYSLPSAFAKILRHWDSDQSKTPII